MLKISQIFIIQRISMSFARLETLLGEYRYCNSCVVETICNYKCSVYLWVFVCIIICLTWLNTKLLDFLKFGQISKPLKLSVSKFVLILTKCASLSFDVLIFDVLILFECIFLILDKKRLL